MDLVQFIVDGHFLSYKSVNVDYLLVFNALLGGCPFYLGFDAINLELYAVDLILVCLLLHHRFVFFSQDLNSLIQGFHVVDSAKSGLRIGLWSFGSVIEYAVSYILPHF